MSANTGNAENLKPTRIAIIGGGIVGMALAVPLARAQKQGSPIDVHVYEAAAAFTEIGAAVGMAPNAQRILTRLDMAQCLDKAMDPARPDHLFQIRRADPGLSMEENFVTEVFGENAGRGAVHRADLLDSLVKLFPAEQVTFHKRLDHYVDTPGSPILLKFVDGTTAEADVLLGCDGIKSVVRRSMFSDDTTSKAPEGKATRARYSGFMTYRALVPMEPFREALGDAASQATMWIAKDRQLLTLPIRQGKLLSVVASVRDHAGERAVGKQGPWADIVPKSLLQNDFQGFNDTVKKILDGIDEPVSWGIFELPELPWFNEGHIAIAGDAAHASTPFQGAGAASGIEDAFILYTLLTHPKVLASPSENIPLALAAYSHVRRPRATMVQRTSAQTGMMYQYHLPGVMDNYKKIAEMMDGGNRLKWIWEWDEDQAVREAFDYFDSVKE